MKPPTANQKTAAVRSRENLGERWATVEAMTTRGSATEASFALNAITVSM